MIIEFKSYDIIVMIINKNIYSANVCLDKLFD